MSWELEGDRLYRVVWAYPDAAVDSAPRRQLLAEGLTDVGLEVLQAGVWLEAALVIAGGEGVFSPPDAVRLSYELPGLGRIEHVALSPAAEPA